MHAPLQTDLSWPYMALALAIKRHAVIWSILMFRIEYSAVGSWQCITIAGHVMIVVNNSDPAS